MATGYFDLPDNDDGHYDENMVWLAGTKINLDATNSREGGRYLFRTSVFIDKGELQALLLLYDAKFILIAVRAGQEGQKFLRHYTWTYKQIKRVTVSEEKNRMFICVQSEDPTKPYKENDLDLLYSSKLECDKFTIRIKTLYRIYNSSRNITNGFTSSSHPIASDQQDDETMTFREEINPGLLPKQQATCPKSPPMDDLFSIENLKRLASASPVNLVIPEVPNSFATTVTPLSASPIAIKNVTNSTATIVSDTKVKVPVELNAGRPGGITLDAEAMISFKLTFDVAAIRDCHLIKDKEERLAKIRSLIQMDASTSLCELKFV